MVVPTKAPERRKEFPVTGILSAHALPDQEINWNSLAEVGEYCSGLSVVRLLGSRMKKRTAVGAVFAGDFFYLLSCVYAEWFGLFGYVPAQILPGLRAPLPRKAIDMAFQNRTAFKVISEAYFGSFGLTGVFAKLPPAGFFYAPAYAFFRDTKFEEGKVASQRFWKVTHPVGGVRFYSYGEAQKEFSLGSEPSGVAWAVVTKHDLFPAFFFPKAFRHFWAKDPEFFKRFAFGGVFDAKAFVTMFELEGTDS